MKTPRKSNLKRGLTIVIAILAAVCFVSACFIYVALQKRKITGQQQPRAQQSETTR